MALRGAVVLLLVACFFYFQGTGSGQEDTGNSWASDDVSPDVDESSFQTRLHMLLLRSYHNAVIPRTPVNTTYSLDFIQIDGVDEKENLLRIALFAKTIWSDHRFVWDPAEFGGVRSINMATRLVWRPDLKAYAQVIEADDVNVKVMYDGTMYHIQPLRLALYCTFTFANYPFDSQTCDLRVESWSHDMSQINLTIPALSPVDLSHAKEHTLWELKNASATKSVTTYACCKESYVSLMFRFTIKRQAGGYTVRVLAPSVLTSLLILMCFLMPPSRGERIIFCSVLLLCVLLQMFHLNLIVPLAGSNSPFLADFLCFSAFLAFFACAESVLAFNLCRGFWGDVGNGRQEAGGEFPGAQTKSNTPTARIARVLDVVCFIIFTFIFAIVGGVILNPSTE